MPAQKCGGLGHDQVGLREFASAGIQVRKRYRYASHWIDYVRERRSVPGFVLPGLKVADLRPADTQEYPQDFNVGGALREHWIEAGATLLDPGKVEAGGVGNRLKERLVADIRIGSRNCSVLPNSERRNRVGERVSEIRIALAAAIARPEIGVNRELGEVGKASKTFVGAFCLAGSKGTEGFEAHLVGALRLEIGIQKDFMAQ